MTGATVVDHIGLLVTNDPALGDGPLGELRDAWAVMVDGRVDAVGTGPARRRRSPHRRRGPLRAARASSTATPTSCSPATAATSSRRGWPGQPYEAGGIRTTSRRHAGGLRRRAAHARTRPTRTRPSRRASPRWRSSPGYGLTPVDEARCLRVAQELTRGDDVPRRARGAGRVRGASRRLRRPRLRRDAGGLPRRTPAGSTPSASGARSTPTSAGRCCRRAGPPASACGSTPTSWAAGPGVQLAVELGCASADHCTYLSDDDVAALAGSTTVATFLPATDFSTRQPYPDARRLHRGGSHRCAGHELQPGVAATPPRCRSASRSPCATCT